MGGGAGARRWQEGMGKVGRGGGQRQRGGGWRRRKEKVSGRRIRGRRRGEGRRRPGVGEQKARRAQECEGFVFCSIYTTLDFLPIIFSNNKYLHLYLSNI